jgi:MA3 domain
MIQLLQVYFAVFSAFALKQQDHERELVSRLLSAAYPTLLDSDTVARGFQRLFEMIDDLQLDAPAARPLAASFLARAVVDEILPPSFLRDPIMARLGGERSHFTVLDNCFFITVSFVIATREQEMRDCNYTTLIHMPLVATKLALQ